MGKIWLGPSKDMSTEKAVDISCIQVDIKILLHSFLAWIARTWLDCKKRGLSGLIWVTFQLLV